MSVRLTPTPGAIRPRIGFLGVGWIGRHRMEAVVRAGDAVAVAVADPSPEMTAEAVKLAPDAMIADDLDGLLAMDLDGIVIATPSAMHAEQSIRALESGVAVFCQKPLGRNAGEVAAVIEAARKADRLLGVDLSYRHTEAMRKIRRIVQAGEIGKVFAAELVFHNAYGPDKDWFYRIDRSGGGCLMDLGIHLADLALWSLDFPGVEEVSGELFSAGERLGADPDVVEDYASATLRLSNGVSVRLACSWRLNAGTDAEIAAVFHGTEGGLAMRNVGGSFYDFEAELYRGTTRETLATPPDEWGGRAAAQWAAKLASGSGFEVEAERFLDSARLLDRIYGRPTS